MSTDLLFLLIILLPLGGAITGLLLGRWRRLQGVLSLAFILAALVSSLGLLARIWSAGKPAVYQFGGWPLPFGIVFVGDLLALTMVVMTQVVMATGVIYALGSRDRAVGYSTFYPLFLLLASGLTGAFLTGDLFNLFVFAELLVLSGAALTAISDDRYGPEAALKYFYISLLASMMMLLAIGSLYVGYGTLNMADLANRIAVDPGQLLLPAAMALLLGTFMIKSAVFPFHFWQPDFHTAAPTAVSAMLSSVVVKLGIYGFIRMSTLLFIEQSETFRGLLVILGVIGVLFGGLSALGTHNVKRMLAYSTLAQVGFILIGVGWGTLFSITAALVFAVNHSLIKAAMLMLAGSVASRSLEKSAAFQTVSGLGRVTPLAGLFFFTGGLALAGIPPTNGFVSKLLFFQSGVDAGQKLILVLAALGGLLTLIYTGRAFQRIWWQSPQGDTSTKPYGDRLLAPAILICLVIILGLWGEPLVNLAGETSRWLSDPSLYTQAVLGG